MMILLQYYRRIIAISMANYYTPTQDKYRTAKWGFENDQQMTTTYHKSPSINKSTEYGQRSRYKSTAISRLQTARKTIDEVILDISEKKDMNDEALKQIRSVNSEIIEDYRKFASPFENRENITKSSVSYFPQKSAQPSTNLANSYHQDESFQLRSRLNGELKRNNELIARLERVEKQNEQLRNNQMSFRSGPRDLELQAQNQRLKHQIGQISMIPQQLFNEMQQLKRQNQSLRNDTVRLLKKVERF